MPEADFITLAGGAGAGAGNVVAMVPKGHRLVRLELLQTDDTPAAVTNFIANVQIYQDPDESILQSISVLNQTQSEESGVLFVFGEGWERNQTKYRIAITSGDGTRMYPTLIIQYLPEAN